MQLIKHLRKCLRRTEVVRGTVFTRLDGTDCHSGKILFKVGKIAEDSGWGFRINKFYGSIHFGEPAATVQHATAGTREIPERAFEVRSVRGSLVTGRKPGAFTALKVKAVKELSLPEILSQFAQNGDPLVREQASRNPYTPVEFLIEMAKDPYAGVRSGVAGNSHTPLETRVEMAEDKSFGVREKVAESPVPPETLAVLAQDEHPYVRGTVAQNPNRPPETLLQLIKDEDPWVRKVAAVAIQTLLSKERWFNSLEGIILTQRRIIEGQGV